MPAPFHKDQCWFPKTMGVDNKLALHTKSERLLACIGRNVSDGSLGAARCGDWRKLYINHCVAFFA